MKIKHKKVYKNDNGNFHYRNWLANISVIAIIIFTILLNSLIMPAILSIISKQHIGLTYKIDNPELQTLTKGPEVPQMVITNINNKQDAKRMAKQYERLFFGNNVDSTVVIASQNTQKHVWEVELKPQSPLGTIYDSGGVYLMRSDGILGSFNMVNRDDSTYLPSQSRAIQTARDIIKKMGYSDDFVYTYNEKMNSVVASRSFEINQQMYLSFFMNKNEVLLLSIKNGWADTK